MIKGILFVLSSHFIDQEYTHSHLHNCGVSWKTHLLQFPKMKLESLLG